MPSRLANRLSAATNRLAFLPFVPAGYPDLATTTRLIDALGPAGADVLEIGFPFSDPIADGPVIQEAFAHALSAGVRTKAVFDAVASSKSAKDPAGPALVAMVSYSIVFRYGQSRFLADAKQAGFDAILIPDLPPPEAQSTCAAITAAGLDTVLLVAPTTTEPRRKEIASLATGFIYYLSVSGITGERATLPPELAAGLADMKRHTNLPLCVGFGISKREHLAQLTGHAHGAIVGSALVRIMQKVPPGQDLIPAVVQYCRELLAK
jgi:tryptophan synthase alpha chain